MQILTVVLLVFCIFLNMLNTMVFISKYIEGNQERREINEDGAGMTETDKRQLENLMSYDGGSKDDTI